MSMLLRVYYVQTIRLSQVMSEGELSNTDAMGCNQSNSEAPALPGRPRIRFPFRPRSAIKIASRATASPNFGSHTYTSIIGGELETISPLNQPIDMRVNTIYGQNSENSPPSWLGNTVRSEILSRHVVYHPDPVEWANTLPSRRFVRLRPKIESNCVTAFATYRNWLIMGMSHGQVILYDMNRNSIIRNYIVKSKYAVTQIITGKVSDKFFVVCANEFVELSYSDDQVHFRFKNQYLIRRVLANDAPILIVDSNGAVFEYFKETEELGRAVVGVIGLNLGEVHFITELKSFDSHIYEKTRPLLLRNKSSLAIVNLSLNTDPKLTLWRKETLSLNEKDNIVVTCFEEKYFYTFIVIGHHPSTNLIYVSSFQDLGSSGRVDFIKPSSGLITGMKCAGNYLLTLTRVQQLEIFDARTHLKRYQISFEHPLNDVTVINNVLVAATKEGSIIIENLFMESNKVCGKCANTFYFEPLTVLKRCFDNLPQESQMHPILF